MCGYAQARGPGAFEGGPGHDQTALPWVESAALRLHDDDAKRVLRTTGVIEFVLEIPPGQRSIRTSLVVVRLKQSPTKGREEFVSERLQPPFPDELRGVFEKLAGTLSHFGYSLVGFGDLSGT